jgi:hypothetical protein
VAAVAVKQMARVQILVQAVAAQAVNMAVRQEQTVQLIEVAAVAEE